MLATNWKRTGLAYLFLAPSLLGLLVFTLYPILDSLYLSFTKWDGLTPAKWIGLDNFRNLATDDTFRISLIHNLYYTAVTVPLTSVVSPTTGTFTQSVPLNF